MPKRSSKPSTLACKRERYVNGTTSGDQASEICPLHRDGQIWLWTVQASGMGRSYRDKLITQALFQGERYDGWSSGTRADNLGRAITHSSQSGDKIVGLQATNTQTDTTSYQNPRTRPEKTHQSKLGQRYIESAEERRIIHMPQSHNLHISIYIHLSSEWTV